MSLGMAILCSLVFTLGTAALVGLLAGGAIVLSEAFGDWAGYAWCGLLLFAAMVGVFYWAGV